MNIILRKTVKYLTHQNQIFLLNLKIQKNYLMSLNIERKNNFQRCKSKKGLLSQNITLNDLLNGKGYIIKDDMDKDYINHCIKICSESRFQKSKEKERNKLYKRSL